MRTSNPVFQVLPTVGDQALLGIGAKIDTLKHGQLGIFNARTGLAVDGTVLTDARDIYFAVGISRASNIVVGTTLADDIVTSAGQMIQTRNTKSIVVKGNVTETQKVVEVSNFQALCSSPYAIKIEFRNQMSYLQNGYNQFSKTFNYWTSCCPQTDCGDCPTAGSSAEVATGLAADINSDPDHLVIATVNTMRMQTTIGGSTVGTAGNAVITIGTTTYTVALPAGATPTTAAAAIASAINTQAGSPYAASSSGAVLSVFPENANTASTDTISGTVPASLTFPTSSAPSKVAYDPATMAAGAGGVLTITGVAQPRPAFNNNVPIKYYKQGTDFIVSLVEGLGMCNGTVTTITNLQYPEGSGYDLSAQEYIAGGWNGKPGPYRTLTLNGGFSKSFEMLVSQTTQYITVILEYMIESIGGADEYYSDCKTIIAIPCTPIVNTFPQLIAALNLIYANRFAALSATGISCASTPQTGRAVASDNLEYVSY